MLAANGRGSVQPTGSPSTASRGMSGSRATGAAAGRGHCSGAGGCALYLFRNPSRMTSTRVADPCGPRALAGSDRAELQSTSPASEMRQVALSIRRCRQRLPKTGKKRREPVARSSPSCAGADAQRIAAGDPTPANITRPSRAMRHKQATSARRPSWASQPAAGLRRDLPLELERMLDTGSGDNSPPNRDGKSLRNRYHGW
jgi:hypothetical protein